MLVKFGSYECHLVASSYENGNPLIHVVDAEDGEPVAIATLDTPMVLPEGHVCIKNYMENEGMLDALMQAGIVSEPVDWYTHRFVTSPICKLLVDIFQKISDVTCVNFVAKTDEFTTWEFETDFIYLPVENRTVDLWRLFVWNNGKEDEILIAYFDDYDVELEDWSELFDVAAIKKICQLSEAYDATKEYNEYYERANKPVTVIDKRGDN